MNHMQSLRFEHKLYAQVKQKMEEMQQHNMSWIEVQFLKKAVDVLCQCRSTLMYTYVFAFYLKKNNQSIIFEVSFNTGSPQVMNRIGTVGVFLKGLPHLKASKSKAALFHTCILSLPGQAV